MADPAIQAASAFDGGSGPASVVLPSATSAGNTILVAAWWGTTAATATVSDTVNGSYGAAIVSKDGTSIGAGANTALFAFFNIAGGSPTISLMPSSGNAVICAVEYAAADANSVRVSLGASGAAPLAITLVGTVLNDVVVALIANGQTTSETIDAVSAFVQAALFNDIVTFDGRASPTLGNTAIAGNENTSWFGVTLAFAPAAGGALAGTSTVVFNATTTPSGSGTLAGTSTVVFNASATPSGAGVLAGTSTVVFNGTATPSASGALAGTSTVVFNAQATPSASGALAGTCAVSFNAQATASGAGAVAGTCNVVFNGTAAPSAGGTLAGTSTVVFNATGLAADPGQTSGTCHVVFSGLGTLESPLFGTCHVVFNCVANTGAHMTTTATLTYIATILGANAEAKVQAAMQPAVVPLPLDFLFAIGAGVTSDSVAVIPTPTRVVRTVVLSLVPAVTPTATATRVGGSSASPVQSVSLTARGQGLVANPIWDVIETSPGITPIRRANVSSTLRVRAVTVLTQGTGYVTPTITAVGGVMAPNGVPAKLTATVALGVITAINVVDPGGPYFSPPTSIVVTGVGSGATFAVADMEISTLTLNDGGEGFVSPVVVATPAFKFTWPDSIGTTDQGAPFVDLITALLFASAASPIKALAPIIA